jgi:hypothetical protein
MRTHCISKQFSFQDMEERKVLLSDRPRYKKIIAAMEENRVFSTGTEVLIINDRSRV